MVGIIGVLTGVVAFLINFIIKYLNQLRYGSMLSITYVLLGCLTLTARLWFESRYGSADRLVQTDS